MRLAEMTETSDNTGSPPIASDPVLKQPPHRLSAVFGTADYGRNSQCRLTAATLQHEPSYRCGEYATRKTSIRQNVGVSSF
jgi:hypothetical protein